MASYDWTQFKKRIPVNASIASVYHLWTTQEGLEKWFLRKSEFTTDGGRLKDSGESVETGDTYYWLWHGYPDSTFEVNKIIDVNGQNLVQFRFAENCIVTINIYPEHNATIVELTQSNIPDDEEHRVKYHLGCMEGWTFYLANLKSILEGGVDLRNKSMEIGGVINS